MNYGNEFANERKKFADKDEQFAKNRKEFLKVGNQFLKEGKEFLKAQRMIYKLISSNPKVTIAEMSVNLGLSDRQIRKYIKRMSDLNFIMREGGRKNGIWKIIDEEYEGFFDRI